MAGHGELDENRRMVNPAERPNLYGLDLPELEAALAPAGVERYRAVQLFDALYGQDKLDPGAWSTLPAALRETLTTQFRVERPQVRSRHVSSDGALKVVLETPDGGDVEAVAIPAEGRMTFCISSQVGCAFGCAFCMTAKLGFGRQLSAGEIAGQVAALMAETGTERGRFNIVFMGMGEPLHNPEGVFGALRLLTAERGFTLGPRRITVSTVGLPAGIDALAEQPIVPRLAVSLVTADQALRETLMPVARRYPLDELVSAIRRFGEGKRDLPTLEVVMLRGVNDAPEHASALAHLARRAHAKVNLIEFNETPELPYRSASEERIQLFLEELSRAGVGGTVRRSRGKDVAGACGQLAFAERGPARRLRAPKRP